MNNEKIKEIIANNSKFSENDVQFLIDEIEYYNDKIEEQKEQMMENSSNFDVMLGLYTEYNRRNQELSINRQSFVDELSKIVEKTNRLGGRISRKDQERKAVLEKNIADIDSEMQNSKLNRQEAKKSIDDMTNERLDESARSAIQNFENNIKANKDNLKEIYDYCTNEMNRIESSIEETNTKINEQSNVVSSIKVENYDSVDEYNQEMKDAIDLMQQYQQELSQYIAYRNEYYYDHRRVINLINNSNVMGENTMVNTVEPQTIENQPVEEPVVDNSVEQNIEPVVQENNNSRADFYKRSLTRMLVALGAAESLVADGADLVNGDPLELSLANLDNVPEEEIAGMVASVEEKARISNMQEQEMLAEQQPEQAISENDVEPAVEAVPETEVEQEINEPEVEEEQEINEPEVEETEEEQEIDEPEVEETEEEQEIDEPEVEETEEEQEIDEPEVEETEEEQEIDEPEVEETEEEQEIDEPEVEETEEEQEINEPEVEETEEEQKDEYYEPANALEAAIDSVKGFFMKIRNIGKMSLPTSQSLFEKIKLNLGKVKAGTAEELDSTVSKTR